MAWLMATSSSQISAARRYAAASRSSRGRLRTAATISSSAHLRLMAVGRVASSVATRALERLVGRVGAQRQADAVGRRRPDQRRAAHLHGRDGARGVVERRQPDGGEAMRQQGLVDHADRPAVGLQPDAARMSCRRPSWRQTYSAFPAKWEPERGFFAPPPPLSPRAERDDREARGGTSHAHRLRSRIQQPRPRARAPGDLRTLDARGRGLSRRSHEGAARRARAELRIDRRASSSTCFASPRRHVAARAVHPWRLLALARSLAVQPHGARAECARRGGRRWWATISVRR